MVGRLVRRLRRCGSVRAARLFLMRQTPGDPPGGHRAQSAKSSGRGAWHRHKITCYTETLVKVSFAELIGVESAAVSAARQDAEASKRRALRWIGPNLARADEKTDVEIALRRAGIAWCGTNEVLVPEQSLTGCDLFLVRSRCRQRGRRSCSWRFILRPEPRAPLACLHGGA